MRYNKLDLILVLFKKMKQDSTIKQTPLTKQELQQKFKSFFEDEANTFCFECNKKSKQWVQLNHGIFVCLNCAALYREFVPICQVKSVGLDLFYPMEIQRLKIGGNARFRGYLAKYNIDGADLDYRLKTIAAKDYRLRLQNEVSGQINQEFPTLEEGREIAKENISLTDMSADQILSHLKIKAKSFGTKTVELGSRAVNKVQTKFKETQFKQGAKKAVQTIGTKAKSLWNFLANKISSVKEEEPKPQ